MLPGPRHIPIWVDPREGGSAYSADNKLYRLQSFFLSPEGREVMECEAEKLGVDMGGSFFSEPDEQGREQEPQNPLWHYEMGGFMATHKDKHIACILAFAQLVGVGRPKGYGGQ